jgi:hypothetical protein
MGGGCVVLMPATALTGGAGHRSIDPQRRVAKKQGARDETVAQTKNIGIIKMSG